MTNTMTTPNALFRTVLLAGLFGVAGTAGAVAQPWMGHHGGEEGGHEMFSILRQVDLSDAQRQQVHTLMQTGRAQSQADREQMRAVMAQIKARLEAQGAVTLPDIAPLMQLQSQIRTRLDQDRMAVMLAVRQVLTPAQIAHAAAIDTKLTALHEQERDLVTPPTPQ